MADNLAVTPGSGATIATDEVTWGGATVHLPLGKMTLGADGVVEVLSKGQQTAANGLPVTLASDQVAVATLADNLSNPTTLLTGSLMMVWDGTNWDRLQTGASDGTGSANKLPVTMFAYNGTNFDRVRGDTVGLFVQQRAAPSGGATAGRLISAGSTNATSLKGSAGQIYMISAINLNAAVRYLKIYNKATAPTVGTDTPVWTFPIPASATGAGFVLSIPTGVEFSLGIALALTTGVADADTGAVAANEIIVNIAYE